jgi:hypothetical protein
MWVGLALGYVAGLGCWVAAASKPLLLSYLIYFSILYLWVDFIFESFSILQVFEYMPPFD